MPAYAAMVSLKQTLGVILASGGLRILGIGGELQSLDKKVDLFLDFLGNNPGGQLALEAKMRKEAYKAEEVIESHVNSRLRSKFIIAVCYVSYLVLVVLLLSIILWIERLIDWLIALIAACIIYVVVLALNAGNEMKAGELRRVSDDFDGIQSEIDAIRGELQLAALENLSRLWQALDSVLASGSGILIPDNIRGQLESLRQQVGPDSEWLKFLKVNHPPEAAAIAAAASVVTDFIESKFSAHHQSTIWRRFCVKIKGSLLASWIYLVVVAGITLAFIIYILSFATSSERLLTTLALGIGVPVFIARELAFQHRSESLEEVLNWKIGRLRNIMNPAIQPEDNGLRNAPDLEGGGNAAVGLDGDILRIKELLRDNSEGLTTVSIVGMGGIGKTTLAKKVYEDDDFADHFDIRGWVTISQKYTLPRVLQRLLGSMNVHQEDDDDDDENTLGRRLHQALFGRRFLIVIDDLWNMEAWDSVTRHVPKTGSNGSRLLLTSRSRYKDIAAGSYCHEVRLLGKEASWALLQKTVFGGRSCPDNLKDSGKAIAKGCGGHPLAIVVIGRVLPKDSLGLSEWEKQEKKLMNSRSTKLVSKCLEILGWSYDDLPSHLKPCFLYMGVVFPTDSVEIPVSKLASLWVAEGFLKTCKDKSSEAVAEEHLNVFIERNMISVSTRSCDGRIRTCSIHHLWRKLCAQKALDQNFLHVVNEPNILPNPQNPRRISIYPGALRVDASSRYLRSLFCSSDRLSNCPSVGRRWLLGLFSSRVRLLNYPSVGFSKSVYLRVLDVLVLHCEAFPGQIIELVSLRYLALSCDAPLPPSISKLGYLETIVHHHRSRQSYPLLPAVIWSMPNLRNLYVRPGCHLPDPLACPLPTVGAQHLQTLVGVTNFEWSKDIIKMIPNLKKLGISYDVSSSIDWSEYQLECLRDLTQLEVLKITVHNLPSCGPPELAFPQNLRKLSLSGCGIPWASIGALPKLEALKLRREACSGTKWETGEDKFPKLLFLLLENTSLEIWETEDAKHFPSLQRLVLRSCRMLKEIPSAFVDSTSLKKVELTDCLPSAVASAEQVQEQQEMVTDEIFILSVSDDLSTATSRNHSLD